MKKLIGLGTSFVMVLALCLISSLPIGEAAANITFTATDVYLYDSAMRIDGYYMNDGDVAGTVKDVSMDVSVEDEDGNGITQQHCVFGGALCYVASGAQVPHSFTIHSSSIPAYDGQIHWNVHTHIIWNNWNS